MSIEQFQDQSEVAPATSSHSVCSISALYCGQNHWFGLKHMPRKYQPCPAQALTSALIAQVSALAKSCKFLHHALTAPLHSQRWPAAPSRMALQACATQAVSLHGVVEYRNPDLPTACVLDGLIGFARDTNFIEVDNNNRKPVLTRSISCDYPPVLRCEYEHTSAHNPSGRRAG